MSSSNTENPPGTGNNGLMIAGVVVLLGAAGGILWYVTKSKGDAPKTVSSVTTKTSTTDEEPDRYLPPADVVKKNEPDAAVEDTQPDSPADVPKTVNTGTQAGFNPCPGSCTGRPTAEINAALQGAAALAKQCYTRVLTANEGISGTITSSVNIGTDGTACGVHVISNTTGSSKLEQCVIKQMRTRYPAPSGGCTTVNVPILFKPR